MAPVTNRGLQALDISLAYYQRAYHGAANSQKAKPMHV